MKAEDGKTDTAAVRRQDTLNARTVQRIHSQETKETRVLLQTDAPTEGAQLSGTSYFSRKVASSGILPSADFKCSLEDEDVKPLHLSADSGVWLIDDDGLSAVANDLQSIVNCTNNGDVILFNTTKMIRPSSRVVVPWNLTLSAYVENPRRVDSAFPLSATKARFTCHQKNAGLFLLQ